MDKSLPDLSPQSIDYTIRAFSSGLCCEVNPIAVVNGKIVFVKLFAYKDRRSVRVMFDLDPGSDSYSELRLVLNLDNQAVSETWLYRWTA